MFSAHLISKRLLFFPTVYLLLLLFWAPQGGIMTAAVCRVFLRKVCEIIVMGWQSCPTVPQAPSEQQSTAIVFKSYLQAIKDRVSVSQFQYFDFWTTTVHPDLLLKTGADSCSIEGLIGWNSDLSAGPGQKRLYPSPCPPWTLASEPLLFSPLPVYTLHSCYFLVFLLQWCIQYCKSIFFSTLR